MADNVLLELKDVRRSYQSGATMVEVLHGIDLTVKAGEMVAIIGPSGSGKSTLMNIIGCLDNPSSGSYKVMGQDTLNMAPDELAALRRDFFGFIFQRYHLLGHLCARENAQVPAVYAGVRKHKRDERAKELLGSLGLDERTEYKPSQLSGGQQQRVSIARALMNGGQIILADEPTGALDTKSGQDVMKTLQELNAQGHTVIIVTHDPRIAACARRVIAIEDGSIKSDTINEQIKDINGDIHKDNSSANTTGVPLSTSLVKKQWSLTWSSYLDRFKEAFIMAYRAMLSNRMRTLLTMLGIIIGIMAVVSVVALARGASEKIIANIAAMGTNTITIYPGQRMGDVRSGRVQSLTPRDLVVLQGQPFVDSVSASVQTNALLRRGAQESNAMAQGVSLDLFRVYGLKVKEGRIFSNQELQDRAQVGVIDDNAAKLFFPTESALGKNIIVGNISVKVIGILAKTDSFVIRGENPNIFMPYTSVMTRLINQNYLSSIVVRIKEGFSTPVAESSIKSLLISRHGRQDFFMQSSDTIMKSIESATSTFTIMISAIAVISLVVGGIGVMNIMLVSVTERTREIGIRMAVGARQSDILSQFLIEAVMVCMLGGLLGVILSYIVGQVIMHFVPAITLSYSMFSIIAAVLTSSAIGIAFGFMPARSASKLNPIEALARE
ncbi:MacB family efflux pump subunit [Anaerobiospirillum sp. NML120448]|uniref:MacB family efflux pump subunit n=1 Tax=Anaerobiospirillum sp. NML120448 TaxID=2932816 RepID=UPI001FF1B656|nr:MacB family efflux pump subunit [Anaerobiospirillum sp. NML120448]MCK0515375.1 MacB family efflux pump subunit [Anaerobiospirillum sp. NML120448]